MSSRKSNSSADFPRTSKRSGRSIILPTRYMNTSPKRVVLSVVKNRNQNLNKLKKLTGNNKIGTVINPNSNTQIGIQPTDQTNNTNIYNQKKYISEVCALSYLINNIDSKGQFYSKKTVAEIHNLIDTYFRNSTTLQTVEDNLEINIQNIRDLTIFFYSQYIDILHDTKSNKKFPTIAKNKIKNFQNFMELVSKSIKSLNQSQNNEINNLKNDIIKKFIDSLQKFDKHKGVKFEHAYYNFIIENYNVVDRMQVQNSIKTNRSRYVVFDQSNTNVGRIFSNRYKIILPIPSLADAGMFTNPECHFWRDLKLYIDDNYLNIKNYENDFHNLVRFYSLYKITENKRQIFNNTALSFINSWIENGSHLQYNVNVAFKNFKLKYKLDQGTIKVPTTIAQSGPVHYTNSHPIEPCFNPFSFTIKYGNLTIMKVTYKNHDIKVLSDFKSSISKKELKKQISSLRNLFTKGIYEITINGEDAAIESKKDAYSGITEENVYKKLLQKHLGDLGPQIWAIANDTFYCTGDISGVCQYLVLSDIITKNGRKVHGPFFETGNRVLYLQSEKMKYHKKNRNRSTTIGTTNAIARNLINFFKHNKTHDLTPDNMKKYIKYILKKPRNKTLSASQSLQRPGATPNR